MAIQDFALTLLPTIAFDTVAVFDQEFNQVFKAARAIKAVVKEQSKVMQHPVETGIVITDHRIVLPIEIELTLILSSLDYSDIYKNIRQFYNAGTLLTVQTRSDVYYNQVIDSMPHEEDPTQFNVIALALNLIQVQFVKPQYGVIPKQSKNQSVQKRGVQQTTTAPASQESAARQGLRGTINFFKGIFK